MTMERKITLICKTELGKLCNIYSTFFIKKIIALELLYVFCLNAQCFLQSLLAPFKACFSFYSFPAVSLTSCPSKRTLDRESAWRNLHDTNEYIR